MFSYGYFVRPNFQGFFFVCVCVCVCVCIIWSHDVCLFEFRTEPPPPPTKKKGGGVDFGLEISVYARTGLYLHGSQFSLFQGGTFTHSLIF